MENEFIKNKIEKFLNAKIPVHIVLKVENNSQPRFLNGIFIGKKADDIYILDERKVGQTYVLVDDIYNISIFTKGNKELSSKRREELKEIGPIGEGIMNEDIDILRKLE